MIETLAMIAKATWLVIAITTGFVSICIMIILGFSLLIDVFERFGINLRNNQSR